MKKKILNISTKVIIATLLMIVFASPSFLVNAAGYTYDFWKNVIPCADGLSLSDVFYQNDIKNLNSDDKDSVSFDTLTDLATYVYEDTVHPENSIYEIYVLDSMKYTTIDIKKESSTGKKDGISGKGISVVYVLNQDFQKIEKIEEFLISDDVKKILDDYYNFHYDLSDIKQEQLSATEFIDFYKTSSNFELKYSDFINNVAIISDVQLDLNNVFNKVIVKLNGEEIDRSLITSSTTQDENGGTQITLNEIELTEDSVLTIEYAEISKYGKAPYYPYTKDATKAAIRLSGASGIARTEDGLYVADSDNARIIRANKNADGIWEVDRVYLTPNDNVFYQVEDNVPVSETTGKTVFNPQKLAVDKTGKVYCIAKNVYEGIIEFDASGSFNRFLGKNEVTANPLKKFWSKIFSEQQLDSLALDLPPEFTNIAIDKSGFLFATSNPDTEATTATKMVKMINTAGKDVMKRNGYVTPDGDVVYLSASSEAGVIIGPSQLVGVTVSNNGNFTVVDKKRGRLFTYDNEGNLLYTTGEQPGGSEAGSTSENIVNPVSINYFTRTSTSLTGEITKEEVLLVLDQTSKSIMLYETTEFGEKVNLAIDKYQNGIFENVVSNGEVIEYGAEYYWNEVLKMNENYELAHLGIGKAQYRRGEYKEAMANFKLAHNANYYSKAYAEYRDSILSANFSWIMTLVIMLVMLWIVLSYRKHLKVKNAKLAASAAMNEEKYNILSGHSTALKSDETIEKDETDDIVNSEETPPTKKNFFAKIDWAKIGHAIKNFFHETIGVPLHILTHPIQGFTEFKNEKKGKMWVALTILLLYVLVEIIAYQYEGIVTNKNNPQNFNSIRILIYGVLPPVILSIANWSVTTLLDGKGKMKEIFMMICYSLVPIILINILNIILSNILTSDEAQFITLLTIIGWVLTGLMVFMGLVVIHEYGMGKTLWSIILTILATLIIAFLALLIFDLAQQIYGFVYSLYKEITTRYL